MVDIPVPIPTAEETGLDTLPVEFRHVDRFILNDIHRIIEMKISPKSIAITDQDKNEDYDKGKDISSERKKMGIGIEFEHSHEKPLGLRGYPPERGYPLLSRYAVTDRLKVIYPAISFW